VEPILRQRRGRSKARLDWVGRQAGRGDREGDGKKKDAGTGDSGLHLEAN